jgi:hypothetical protein
MTLALWMLLGFASWTLMVLAAGVGVSRWLLIFQGAAQLTSFPGDTRPMAVPPIAARRGRMPIASKPFRSLPGSC